MGAEARTRVAIWFVVATAVVGFGQTIDGTAYVGPAVLGMLLASATVMGIRRLGGGALVAIAGAAAGLAWYLSIVFRAPLTAWSLPTPAALQEIWAVVTTAYGHSLIDYAPVPLREAYAVLIVGTIWIATVLAELTTFRWKRPLLAVALPLVMFSLSMVVGTGEGAAALVLLFLAALFAFWASESRHRLRSWGGWLDPGASSGAMARRLGAGCLAVTFMAPLFLPAIGDGLVSWRSGAVGEGSGAGDGTGGAALSPWVSIVPRLIQQSDREMFRIEATDTTYWRTTSLEFFDGLGWREESRQRFLAPDGSIAGETDVPGTRAGRADLDQRVTVIGLRGEALPAAPVPSQAFRITDDGRETTRLHYDAETGAVFVAGGLEEGDVYEVTSSVPRVSYEELNESSPPAGGYVLQSFYRGGPVRQDRAEPDPTGAQFPEVYYQLPSLLSEEVVALTRRWTRGHESPLEKLVEIQRRLRAFDYTLNPDQAGDHDYLRRFLLETRAGYCQQFATAFAVMARILDYPTRVSVGFLPGAQDLATGAYSVKGTDAHAWPEVYFEDYGWIAFEPTPRDAYAAPIYTAPSPENGPIAGGGAGIGPGERSNVDPGREGPRGQVGTGGDGARSEGMGPGGSAEGEESAPWQAYFRALVTFLALGLAVLLSITPLLKEARARRRYERARDARGRRVAAFQEFQSHARELADERRPDESARAYLYRLAAAERIDPAAAKKLVALYEAARYARPDVSMEPAEERALVKSLRSQLWARASWWARGAHVFSPRGLKRA